MTVKDNVRMLTENMKKDVKHQQCGKTKIRDLPNLRNENRQMGKSRNCIIKKTIRKIKSLLLKMWET